MYKRQAAGGSDFPTKNTNQKDLFGGGSGAGITISPVAFLSVSNGDVKLLQVEPFQNSTDRVIGMVPEVVDKISSLFKKSEGKSTRKSKKEDSAPVEEVALEDPVI